MHQLEFLLLERFLLLDLAGPRQVFSTCNAELVRLGQPPLYTLRLLSAHGGPVSSACGLPVPTEPLPPARGRTPRTLLVVGGPGIFDDPAGPVALRVSRWLRRSAAKFERITAVCTGPFVLARAGLLDGRRATTHWMAGDALRAEAPAVDLQPNAIYVIDGKYWTSAGVTAGIDMALALVERDAGRELAMAVAKKLVVFLRRPGGQTQFSSALLAQTAKDPRLLALHQWIRANLARPLPVHLLAERLAMSVRTFDRFYAKETGGSPAKGVERIRVEHACNLMESTTQPLSAIARRCGFSSEEIMRRAFLRHLAVSPAHYRQRFSPQP
jgi:transcriptional regulator GlxA family with amidase domain